MLKINIIILFTSCAIVNSAPVVYDQRQDGKLNVHADLENFLVVIATNGKSYDFDLNSLLMLKLMEARQKATESIAAEKFEYKLEESSADEGKEPYSVEILKLRKEDEKKELQSTSELNRDQIKPVLIQENTKTVNPPDVENDTKKDLEDSKTIKLKVNTSRKRSQHTPSTQNIQVKVVQGGHTSQSETAEKVIENFKEKKIRSGNETKEEHPIKLLGDAIEECGPGRLRNISGICEISE